jgi:hypothetical protein
MWADNGDALSRIYAGTGALKSSFTRHGKMSLAGFLADARKSATRTYINNFADKGRQNTIDLLLGRLMGQVPVHLYDPINDYVVAELNRRSSEFTEQEVIHILVGTFNLNGRTNGIDEDLSAWLCPDVDPSQQCPEIVAVGFQEIVELSPQQIMSTDPARRQLWESAVIRCLNDNAARYGKEEYVMLRGGQLVGASLSIFVRASSLKAIKNVEGSVKKVRAIYHHFRSQANTRIDRYVRYGGEQRSGSHPHGIRKHLNCLRYSPSGGRVCQLRRTQSRLQDH